ncbi:MAG: ribose-phosphate pyrophosphokinase [Burkholderiales bacterium]|nr:ribose-phosphate pyrophosphokinase [Burkholderiales bacterium]
MTANTLIFSLPGNEVLADDLVRYGQWQRGQLQYRRFPDGESNVRFLDDVAGQDVVLVCSLAQPDEKIMPLYFAASIARELGARSVGLVLPYLAYMRQDARFNPGEGITSAHFARLLSKVCNWMVTVDPHLHRHHDLSEIYTVPTRVVQAAPEIAKWVSGNVSLPVLVGPDEESGQWVAAVAQLAGCPYTVLRKVRHGDHEVEVSVPDTDLWQGMTPVLIDDIASTARTMMAASAHLHKAGMKPPVCIAVHALFAGDAYASLQAAHVAQIVSCDTVLHESNQIGMAAALVVGMREMLAG